MSAPTPWPTAAFDPVRRLHVIAAVTPGAAVREALIDAPFERVWAAAADLEEGLPRWLPDIRSVRVAGSPADGRTEALVTGHTRLRARFDVELTPGWCLMRSRFLLGGMAARAEAGGTRFAFLGAFRLPGAGLLDRALRPATDPLARRSLERFERLVREG
ncbi:SRPBCC family protein [Kitasatospora sp. NPDC086009]|uniref:SRPBCC family protein n=1 Tax=unclassified Kitasatospora TaxID=2633591 RepID=UPI002E330699|nr:SRPBCC family protein [Kitasatospora sp. NBC_01246]